MQAPGVTAFYLPCDMRTLKLVRTLKAVLHSRSLEQNQDLLHCLCWGRNITGRLISVCQEFLSMGPVIALNGQRGFSKLLFQNIKEGLLRTNMHNEDIWIYLQSLAKHSPVSSRSQPVRSASRLVPGLYINTHKTQNNDFPLFFLLLLHNTFPFYGTMFSRNATSTLLFNL